VHKDRLTVFQLPSRSSGRRSKEKGTHLPYFPSFGAVKDKVHETLSFYDNAKEEILSLMGIYQAHA
jgi:hypothetical protein